MATRNRPLMVGSAIQSVLDQDSEDWTLTIFDNSTEPGTFPIPADDRVFLHYGTASGPADAFQQALELSVGEFVMPLADDDTIEPHTASVIKAALTQTGKQWGYAQTAFEQAGECILVLGDVFDLERLRNEYYLGGAVFWRRSLTDRIGGFEDRFDSAADYGLYLRMAEDSVPVVVPSILYRYNDHAETDSRVNAARQADASRRISEEAIAA